MSRLTAVGRFLRATSLDELPSCGTCCGETCPSSGRAPERACFVQRFVADYPHYMARHRVPSVLTGPAQVNGLRGDMSIPERIRLDNAYIEGWSLWLDVKIVLRAVRSVLRRTGS